MRSKDQESSITDNRKHKSYKRSKLYDSKSVHFFNNREKLWERDERK